MVVQGVVPPGVRATQGDAKQQAAAESVSSMHRFMRNYIIAAGKLPAAESVKRKVYGRLQQL